MATSVNQKIKTNEKFYLYGGKVIVDFNDASHRYRINGEPVSGVTTALGVIAKPALIWWSASQAVEHFKKHLVPGKALDEVEIQQLCADARRAHDKTKNSAADAGTFIHDWIEDFVRGNNPPRPVNPELNRTIEDFLEFWNAHDIEVIEPEKVFASPKHKLAGRTDLLCRVDGELTIMDWKTGKGIYAEAFLQLAAYALMYEEEFPDQKIQRLHLVNASVVNVFSHKFTREVKWHQDLYLKVLEVYKLNKELEKKFEATEG